MPQPSQCLSISSWAKGRPSASAWSVSGAPSALMCFNRRECFSGILGLRVTLIFWASSALFIADATISWAPCLRKLKNSLREESGLCSCLCPSSVSVAIAEILFGVSKRASTLLAFFRLLAAARSPDFCSHRLHSAKFRLTALAPGDIGLFALPAGRAFV